MVGIFAPVSEMLTSAAGRFARNFIAERRYLWVLEGLGTTLILSALAAAIGIAIGLLLTFMKLSEFGYIRYKPLRNIAKGICRTVSTVYLDIIRGTPSFVQLIIIYYVIFSSSDVNKIVVAAIAFGINSGAYVAEIIRAGILSVDHGQTEAGYSLGLSSVQTMVHIVIPQAVKNILPTLANEFIVLIKETAVVCYIPVRDLMKVMSQIQSKTYDAAYPYIGAAIIYYVIIKILSLFFNAMEKRLRKSDYRA